MNYGYSQRLINSLGLADNSSLAILLGQRCVEKDIPIRIVAKELRVSRATVYGWFSGRAKPSPKVGLRIVAFLQTTLD